MTMPNNTIPEELESPNEHLEIPKWINEDYFSPILEKNVDNFKRILRFIPIAATAPGENYTSIMVRIFIDAELKDGSTVGTSYILKTMLGAKNEGVILVNSMNLFPKEKQMYANYLPKFEQLYREAGLDVQFGPKCFNIEETPERITLVMEDLKCKGFANMDRLRGLDRAHIQKVLHKLAELHAASAVYQEQNGPYEDMYQMSYFTEANRSIFTTIYNNRTEIFKKAMLQWNLADVEKYIAKMPTFDEYFDEGKRINTANPTEFNVLNHGDCWTNNIMFTHTAQGKIDQMLFVDFQVCKWGTPAQDLWYFIITSVALDIKVKEFDNFIFMYHERLVECLKLLNYSKAVPSLKDLHIMMLKYGFWGVFTANGAATAILLPSDKDAHLGNFMNQGPEADKFRFKIFTNPFYVKAMRQVYPFLNNKGLFDLPPK